MIVSCIFAIYSMPSKRTFSRLDQYGLNATFERETCPYADIRYINAMLTKNKSTLLLLSLLSYPNMILM